MNPFDLPPSQTRQSKRESSRPQAPRDRPGAASVQPAVAGTIGRVLVVRDDPPPLPSSDALVPGLRRSGFSVQACRADEAPALLARGVWDVLLADVGICAGEVLEWVRGLSRSAAACALPVLLLGNPSRSAVPAAAALTAGAHDCLAWPFDPVELAQRLANLTELSRLRRSRQDAEHRFQAELAARSASLDGLVEAVSAMSLERDPSRLRRRLLDEGRKLLHCDGGTLYGVTGQKTLRFELRTRDDDLPSWQIPLYNEVTGRPNDSHVAVHAAVYGCSVSIDDVYREARFDLSGVRAVDAAGGHRTVSMLTVPVAPRGGEAIGVLQFTNALDRETGQVVPFPPELVGRVEALAAQAAVALDNLDRAASQSQLTESLARLLAIAVDTRCASPGRHGERVPELAMSLARAACRTTEGPLADFAFHSEDEWQEFRLGAWLHDCGQLTTPQHLIGKATKLETIANRIHEIRMRFEVLLRDLEIERLQQRLRADPAAEDDSAWAARCQRLRADFAFVADCNLGHRELTAADVRRLAAIGRTPWLRCFDDRLGLSEGELDRLRGEPAQPLPATEALLADRIRPGVAEAVDRPGERAHQGELHQLSVRRGRLTPQERCRIDEHRAHAIALLEGLPFPKHLGRVPEYAVGHHDRMDGEGAPRRSSAEALSVPARILAVVDLFDSLTAADRSSGRGKKLSEALTVLRRLAGSRIDVDVFNLFVRSGVFLDHARRHLTPEQIDVADGTPYLRLDAASVRPARPRPA